MSLDEKADQEFVAESGTLKKIDKRLKLCVQKYSGGGYMVDIRLGNNEPIQINEQIARVVASLLKDPRVSFFDIPIFAGIDEGAKPILAEAIQNYRGLGCEIDTRDARFENKEPEQMNPWIKEQLLKSNNYNLISVNNTLALREKAKDNGQMAEELTRMILMSVSPLAYSFHDRPYSAQWKPIERKPLTKDDCEMIRNRMLLICANIESFGRKQLSHSWRNNTSNEWKLAFARTKQVAKAHGVEITIPAEFSQGLEETAGEGSKVNRSATMVAYKIPRGKGSKPAVQTTTEVFKDIDAGGTTAYQRYLQRRQERDMASEDIARKGNSR